ncbi:MAG TPA: ATP-binding protein [Planctomycetota bacterium]|nr:ATP-binding protein [Planctomycetota bacterium]
MTQRDSMEAIVVSPLRADVELTCALLSQAGIDAAGLTDITQLAERLPDGAGCGIVVEEALSFDGLEHLSQIMRVQPAWCDFPLIVIAGTDTEPASMVERLFPYSGNVTLLPRPLSPTTLVSTVRVALRARARQYEVRRLLDEREQSLRRRDEFLAMLAHELRNPLAPIRNATHVMKALKIDDPLFVKTRALIEKQVVHITRMVNDLLDVSRLELGKVELQRQRFSLNSAVSSAVEACGEAIRSRRHALHLNLSSDPLLIDGDTVRMEQVVCNLLMNAVKYTPPDGQIWVMTEASGADAVLTIRDTGVGISSGMEHGIFDLFQQDKRTLDRSDGGLGIGLTVARRLIELHGGTIQAFSRGLNEGSTFTVRLPRAAAHAASEAAPRAEDCPAPLSRRILVVEDNADVRESLELLLKMWGHDVYFAETGPDGLKRALEIKPEIALVDIGLPGMNGYEVARNIRRSPQLPPKTMKLVALTGYGQQSDIASAREAGFDVHLLKPVDPDLLAKALAG